MVSSPARYPGAVAVRTAVCAPSGQRSSTPPIGTGTDAVPARISTVEGRVASLLSEVDRVTVTAAVVGPLRETVAERAALPSTSEAGVSVNVRALTGWFSEPGVGA